MGANYAGMAIAGYNVVAGQINLTKANAEANRLEAQKPVKKTSQFDRNAYSLSESELENGISAETQQAYDDGREASLSSSISAMLKSGGSANNIADIYGGDARARQQMAIIEDNMRLKKVESYLSESRHMAEEDEKNWLVNDYGPYINKLKAVGEAKKAAAAQTAKGLDSLGGSMGGSKGGGTGSTGGATAVSQYDFSGGGNTGIGSNWG